MPCQRRYSLRMNTFLYESKLSHSKFFDLVYHFLKGNYCIEEFALEIGLNKNTIVKFNKLIRQAILEYLSRNPERIGREGLIV